MATAKQATKTTQADELTILQASELFGVKQSQITTALNSHPVFKADPNSFEKRAVEGSNFKLTWIKRSALEAWIEARKAASKGGVSRVKENGSKYFIWVKAEQMADVTQALEKLGIKLEKAYKGKKSAEASAATPTQPDLFSAEPVNAEPEVVTA